MASTTRSTPSENGEEAQKDKPRDWCWNYCPYATDCRGRDTDASGLIEDPVTIEAIAAYREANGVIRAAEGQEVGADSPSNTSGSTGEFAVRWVEVPGGHVEYDRAPCRKIGHSAGSGREVVSEQEGLFELPKRFAPPKVSRPAREGSVTAFRGRATTTLTCIINVHQGRPDSHAHWPSIAYIENGHKWLLCSFHWMQVKDGMRMLPERKLMKKHRPSSNTRT